MFLLSMIEHTTYVLALRMIDDSICVVPLQLIAMWGRAYRRAWYVYS